MDNAVTLEAVAEMAIQTRQIEPNPERAESFCSSTISENTVNMSITDRKNKTEIMGIARRRASEKTPSADLFTHAILENRKQLFCGS